MEIRGLANKGNRGDLQIESKARRDRRTALLEFECSFLVLCGALSLLGENDGLHERMHGVWLARETPLKAELQAVTKCAKRRCVARTNAG